LKLYKGYFDNEDVIFTIVRPADSKAHFYSLYGGYGEILKIEDVTEGENNANRSTETSQREIQQKSSKGSH
jgi:hypothetical protein